MTGANERRGASEVAPPEAAQAGHQAPASPVAPSRSEWLDWRRRGIGASDVAMLLGISPWGGPWDLWMAKVHGFDGPDRPELAMGRAIEPLVLAWAAEELECRLEPGERLEERGPLRGTPDGFLSPWRTGERAGIEAKTARYPDGWGEAGSDEIPAHYLAQVRAYLALSGLQTWIVAVWFLGNYQRRLYVVEADAEHQRQIREAAAAWWQRHVVEGAEPPVDGSDACRDWLVGQSPTARDEIRAATGDEELLARDVHAAEQAAKSLEAEAARARNRLRASMGDVRRVYFTGGAATWSRKSNRLTVRIDP